MALSSGTMHTRSGLILILLVNAVVSLDLRGAGNAEAEQFYEDLHAEGRDGYIKAALENFDSEKLIEAANYGNPEALCTLGTMFETGVGCDRDVEKACDFYLRAAMDGHVGGMYNMGSMYWAGHGVQQDYAEAATWFKEAASQSCDHKGYCRRHYLSRFRLGESEVLIERGANPTQVERVVEAATGAELWTPQQPDTDLEKLLEGAAVFEEDVEAMKEMPYDLVHVWGRDAGFDIDQLLPHGYEYTTSKVDFASGRVWIGGRDGQRDAIESLASVLMSFMLRRGVSDAESERSMLQEDEAWSKTLELLVEGVQQGDGRMAAILGVLHRAGMGIEPDDEAACKLFAFAAEKGVPEGMCNLGVCFERGSGLPQDDKKALEWYKKAAKSLPAAKTNLAAMLHRGAAGLAPNPTEALRLYQEAAKAGDGAAMNNLGVMHALGNGVPLDPVEGVRWLRRAAEVPSGVFVTNDKHTMDAKNQPGAQRDLGEVPGRNSVAAALYNLGLLHEAGLGVVASAQAAARWFALAAEKAVRDSGNAPGILI